MELITLYYLDRDADFLVRDTERFALRSLDRDFEGDFFLGLGERLRSALFSSPFRSRSAAKKNNGMLKAVLTRRRNVFNFDSISEETTTTLFRHRSLNF